MKVSNIEHMFPEFVFKKSAVEIVTHVTAKMNSIKNKIEERQKRVADLRKEYAIDDSALVQLLTAARKNAHAQVFQYTSSLSNAAINTALTGHTNRGIEEKTIGAGVVNNLLTENDFIEGERDQVKRLELIARNLSAVYRFANDGSKYVQEHFKLSFEELDYLGF